MKAPAATLIEADVMALPFADASFDLVLGVTLLCFASDRAQAVSEMVRVTRPGGRVVLGELNRWSLWAARRRVSGWRGSETWRAARFFTPRTLAGLLRDAGAREVTAGAAAYLPPASPRWLIARSATLERGARRLGSAGAAFSVARGQVGAS